MGDLIAKVGGCAEHFKEMMGEHGVGERNENGELLLELCGNFELILGGTMFKHKTSHKITWVSLDGQTENQIDHICINLQWKEILLDVRNRRGADIGLYHHLLIAKLKL